MRTRSVLGSLLATAALAAGAVLVGAPPAAADAVVVPATCTGIPIVGTLDSDVTVNASDDVDPVAPGGTVVNTINVPVPAGDVPIEVSVKELKITLPIPAGVTVTNVTFTPSSFPTQVWQVSSGSLVATLTGSVPLGGGAPTPTVPDLAITTTVAGPPRTVTWKVPSSITAKATYFLGSFTATCAPDDPNQSLLTTSVVASNQAPTATDQTVPVAFETATPVTLAGTDPDGDPLTFAVATQPADGTLSGVAPNLTYTPDPGFDGTDSFTFTASDGTVSDTGTVTLEVSEAPTTAPGSPVLGALSVGEGRASISWTPPGNDGGSPITGYVVTPVAAGVDGTPVEVGAATTSATVDGLANGVSHTFEVAAVNAVGAGPPATSSAFTPQWWLPWSSGPIAVTEIFTWLTGAPPSSSQLSSWLAQLDGGSARPGDLVALLRAGTDATANVDPTVRLYSAYLTRIPDAGGLNFWLERRRSGWTLWRISDYFANSSEFKRRYGALSNRDFVEQIYLNVLGRKGDAGGVDYWTGQLDQKRKSRGQVMINFSESSEYKRKQVGNVHAAAVYIHLVGKAPTVAQRDAFVTALPATALADLVRALIAQPSFAARAG